MKATLIKIIDDHYVMVNDSEIKEGDWVVGCTRTVVQCMYPENVHDRDVKKITHSTQPIETFNWMGNSEKGYDTIKPLSLQEIKELIGEVDVEKKAMIEYEESRGNGSEYAGGAYSGYIKGYNQAIEDKKEKKYTEEDMRNAILIGMKTGYHPEYHIQSANRIIQSIQLNPQWEVTFDEQGKLRLV